MSTEELVCVVHDEVFHADDVGAVAILRLVYPDLKVTRTRNGDEIKAADFAVDVGGKYNPEKGRFDHHQDPGPEPRENGIPYAAIGLVWRHFGAHICNSEEVASSVEKGLIQCIDAADNGVKVFEETHADVGVPTINELIFNANPPGNLRNPENQLAIFEKMVGYFQFILEGQISRAQESVRGRGVVRHAILQAEDPRVVILDEEVPWKGTVITEAAEALYVVHPTSGGKWRVTCVPPEKGSYEKKKPLPASWGGLRGKDLQEETGVEDAYFVHKGLFTAGAESLEGAKKLAELAVEAPL